MKTYRVWASYTVDLYADIEAESEDGAVNIARVDMDGGNFLASTDYGSDWEIGSAVLIESIKVEGETP